MVSIVNGFVCRSGCDEATARKGRDPRNPTDDPVKADALDLRDGKTDATGNVVGARAAQIVSFGEDASTVASSSGPNPDRRSSDSPALVIDRTA